MVRITPSRLRRIAGLPEVSVWAVATGLVALVGPFGTYAALPIAERVLYWGVLIGCAFVIGIWARRVIATRFPASRILVEVASGLALGMVLGPAIWAFNLHIHDGPPEVLPGLAVLMLEVLAVCLGLVAISLYRNVPVGEACRTAGQDTEAEHVPFLRRLDPLIGEDLSHLSANNHHLDIFTRIGCCRLLMRFSDALEELAAYDGLRIHRSHWVALPVIDRLELEDRKHVVVLTCGTRLPVSGAYLAQLEHHGYRAA